MVITPCRLQLQFHTKAQQNRTAATRTQNASPAKSPTPSFPHHESTLATRRGPNWSRDGPVIGGPTANRLKKHCVRAPQTGPRRPDRACPPVQAAAAGDRAGIGHRNLTVFRPRGGERAFWATGSPAPHVRPAAVWECLLANGWDGPDIATIQRSSSQFSGG